MLQPEQPSLSSYLVMGLTATADSSPIAESTVTCQTQKTMSGLQWQKKTKQQKNS